MSSLFYDKIYALTGAPGSGKTTVATLLNKLGAKIISADDIAHVALELPEVNSKIRKTFGEEILSNDKIDRRKLGKIIFNNQELRQKLEKIIHPEIRILADREMKNATETFKGPIIYDCPLLFETGLNKLNFKKIIVVTSPIDTCIQRTIARDQVSQETAKNRIASQMPLSEKIKLADIIIDNSGTLEQLNEKTKELYDQIKSQ